MKFGNVSAILLTLSPTPWHDGYGAVYVDSAPLGDNALAQSSPTQPTSNSSSSNATGGNAIVTAMVAPPWWIAVKRATTSTVNVSQILTGIAYSSSARHSKRIKSTLTQNKDKPEVIIPVSVDRLYYVGAVLSSSKPSITTHKKPRKSATTIEPIETPNYRSRRGHRLAEKLANRKLADPVGSELSERPMVALYAVVDRVADNRTDDVQSYWERRQLPPPLNASDSNVSDVTVGSALRNSTARDRVDDSVVESTFPTLSSTLSYTWNWTAAVLDEIQTFQIDGSNPVDFDHSNRTSNEATDGMIPIGTTHIPYVINDDVINSLASTSASITRQMDQADSGFEFGDTAARSAALAVLLALFCAFTVFGNVLVMAAVARERYLHTVTNYFVVSLATADCLVGALVMPFSVVHETMSRVWIFGRDWCDVWHSLDVLASTASILNLCVISLDRYWAITDPITYPSKMTTRRAVILIAVVWVCSSLISFPAIAWWRAVSPSTLLVVAPTSGSSFVSSATFASGSPSADSGSAGGATVAPPGAADSFFSTAPRQPAAVVPMATNVGPACTFTEDIGYLVFSSIISFYGPLTVMVFTYYRIYRAAAEQTRSLRLGTKQVLACNGEESMELTLRIHRGGGGGSGGASSSSAPTHTNGNGSGGRRSYHPCSSPTINSDYIQHGSDSHSTSSCSSSSVRVVPKNLKHFSFSRKLARLAKEQKAAKTLGIVMGVFVLCWMPFFLCNILLGLCPDSCFRDPQLVSSVVTWLGWINSGMNPVIYACWSRDFRRAFTKILCGCCPRLMVLDGGVAGGHRTMRHRLRSRVCQSSSTPLSSTCSAECVRL